MIFDRSGARWRLRICLLALVAALDSCKYRPTDGSALADAAVAPTGLDAFKTLNKLLAKVYTEERAKRTQGLDPLILAEFNKVVAIKGGVRTEFLVIPPAYSQLKYVAHIPLTTYLLVNAKPVDPPKITELSQMLAQAEANIDSLNLPADLLADQKRLIEASKGILDMPNPSHDAIVAFARSVSPTLLSNAKAAAAAQIEQLDQKVRPWVEGLSPDEKQRLRVVVSGTKAPRNGNIFSQYFAKLLGTAGESNQIEYIEAIFDEKALQDQAGSLALDGEIGDAVFNDGTRMYRDLLADGAKEVLGRTSSETVCAGNR